MAHFVDIHTHHWRSDSPDVIQVYNVNWPNLYEPDAPIEYCSIGLHPWYLEDNIDVVGAIDMLSQQLDAPNVLMLGECGLDKLIPFDIASQKAIFQIQLSLAERIEKPVVIHCVRAFSEFLLLRRRFPSLSFVIHGFNNNTNIVKELLAADCYISLGAALQYPSSNASSTIQQIPLHRLFLETDNQQDFLIENIYELAAQRLAMPLGDLQEILMDNFENIKKFPHH